MPVILHVGEIYIRYVSCIFDSYETNGFFTGQNTGDKKKSQELTLEAGNAKMWSEPNKGINKKGFGIRIYAGNIKRHEFCI